MKAPRPLKVGIDWREFVQGTHTGIQSYLLTFLEGAVARRPQWEFHLFGNKGTVFPLKAPNVHRHPIREGVRVWWDQVRLVRGIRAAGLDVFLTPYVKVPVLTRVPVIVWMNDLSPILLERWGTAAERLYFRVMCVAALLKATTLLTISEATAADIRRVFRIGSRKLRTVHLALRPFLGGDSSSAEDARRRFGIEGAYVLHVSNLRPHKNVLGLLRAYAMLAEEIRARFPLILVGKKENLGSEAEELLRSVPLRGCVKCLGQVGDGDLRWLYGKASLFVFPSLYEGFGLPVLEAMQAGVPVVASSVSSVPEIVGEGGILVSPTDSKALAEAMGRMLQSEAERHHWSEAARRNASRFTIDRMVDGMLGHVEQALEK